MMNDVNTISCPKGWNGRKANARIRTVLIAADENLSVALRKLNDSSKQVLFVTDGSGRLKASLCDGDIRRFLLAGGALDSRVSEAAHYNPRFLMTTEREKAAAALREWHLPAIPIVDEDMVMEDVVFRYETVDVESVEIRPLGDKDLAHALEFFDQMAGDTRAMFNRGDVNRIRMIEHLNRTDVDGEIHFAAFTKDHSGRKIMVGYVFLWDIDTNVPWLGIAVREDWKGHHLGRSLLSYVDNWAIPKGYGGLMLTSVPANIRAHSLYARMGFEYMGVYSDGEFLYIKRYER